MNRAKRIILPIVITVVLTIITCIPIFAITTINNYYTVAPADLGAERYENDISYTQDTFTKFYIKFTEFTTGELSIQFFDNNGNQSFNTVYSYTVNNNVIYADEIAFVTEYSTLFIPKINNIDISNINELYIPFFSYNAVIYKSLPQSKQTIYNSTEVNYPELQRQYYQLGYNDGYIEGMYDGQNSEQYTNLTGYVTQLITQFVGSETAPYITPIAIVLVILFVYFVFIRFLLSLIKAKGVIKTCDIIMIVACIILLVVMYAPMLDLTIKTETITDTLETTETTIVRKTEYIYDEQGRIIGGPAGTIIYDDIETTSSDQMVTEDEITFQYLEKEITTYEETQKTDIRD